MAGPVGPAADAIQAMQAALAAQQASAGEADRVLAEVLTGAHAATVEAITRLDVIAAEIDDGVAHPAGFALDTPMGARELQKFLITKQREITAILTAVHQLDEAHRTRFDALRAAYPVPGEG